jgi:hypothetical protein
MHAEAGIRKRFCQAVRQRTVVADIKHMRFAVRESLLCWIDLPVAGNYTYPELTPISVALTAMLYADKKCAPDLRGRLTDDDIAHLVTAAGDSDRTVRVYATEFLVDLGDRRPTKLASPQAATSDDNARYNWLLGCPGRVGRAR